MTSTTVGDPHIPTRDQLEKFLPDHELVRTFEKFFRQINELLPEDIININQNIDTLFQNAASAVAKANAAMAKFNNLKYVDFDRYAPFADGPGGRLGWDDTDGTLHLTLQNGNIVARIGICQFVHINNRTGSTLNKGQVVYIDGAQGNRVTVDLARADAAATSKGTIGFVGEDIANNASGFVMVQGCLSGIDTSSFSEGDIIYLSASTAGDFTATQPTSPDKTVRLGVVIRSHATVGQVYIKVDVGMDLGDVDDVAITAVSNDDLLQYDNTSGTWQNVSGPAGSVVGTTDVQTLTNKTLTSPTLSYTSNILVESGVTLSNGAGGSSGTLTNAPSAGNPTKWVAIDDNGTTRYIPTWT